MSTHDGSRVTDDGVWAQEVGDGPLVALVHGAMDRSGGMLRVRRLLQDSCRVLRYDRRGYARSLPAGPPASFDQQVDDLAQLLDGRPAVLAGHSFGGVICLALAERRPDIVRSVLAYESPTSWAPWWPSGTGGNRVLAAMAEATGPDADGDGAGDGEGPAHDVAEWFLRRMIGDDLWDRMPRGMRAERRAEGPTLVAEMRSVRPPAAVPFAPENITVPVLAARGSLARSHHVRATDELAAAVPCAELVVLDGVDHGAHLSHPEEFARLVRRALEMADEAS